MLRERSPIHRRFAAPVGRLAIGVALLSLAATAACRPSGEEVVRIGVLCTSSGPAAGLKSVVQFGAESARQAAARDPRLRGLKFELVSADVAGGPQDAVRQFQVLTRDGRVSAVLVGLTSDDVLALAPFANRAKVVLLTPSAVTGEIRYAGDYVFRNALDSGRAAEILGQNVEARFGKGPVAALSSSREQSRSSVQAFASGFVKASGRPPVSLQLAPEGAELSKVVAAVRALSPAAVYISGTDVEIGGVIKEAGRQGLRGPFFANGMFTGRITEIAGPAAEGLVFTAENLETQRASKRATALVKAFTQKTGLPGHGILLNTYDAMLALMHSYATGARTGSEVRDGLYSLPPVSGLQGPISFDSDGESNPPIGFYQLHGGEMKLMPKPVS